MLNWHDQTLVLLVFALISAFRSASETIQPVQVLQQDRMHVCGQRCNFVGQRKFNDVRSCTGCPLRKTSTENIYMHQ